MRGGEGFANSIGHGLDKLADGLGKFLEKRREEGKLEVAQGKAAMATLAASPELQKFISVEDAKRLSPGDQAKKIYGTVAGIAQEQGVKQERSRMEKAIMDMAVQKSQLEGYQQQTQQRVLDAAAMQRYNRSAANMQTPLQIPEGTFGVSLPGMGAGGSRLNPPDTVGGIPLDGQMQMEQAARAGLSDDQQAKMAESFHRWRSGSDPLDQLKAETESKRVNAYAKSVDDQIANGGKEAAAEYAADDFKFDANGNPTHWRVGNAFVKWNPKNQLVPGSKRGTVRVIPPPSNPFGTMVGGQLTADVPESAPPAATNAPTAAPLDDFKAWLQKKQSK